MLQQCSGVEPANTLLIARKNVRKLDWKRHKKDCKSLIINSNIMNQKSGSEDFTGDYDNWKTSVQAALTCILCTALADGDCIFSHFASL